MELAHDLLLDIDQDELDRIEEERRVVIFVSGSLTSRAKPSRMSSWKRFPARCGGATDEAVRFPSAAKTGVDLASDRYLEMGAGLETRFQAELRRALERIQQQLESEAIDFENIRLSLMRRLAYADYFCNLERLIWVVSFSHTSRQPSNWLNRPIDA